MRIVELTLFSHNLEAQKQFYQSVFGVDFYEDSVDHFSFQAGWTKVTFRKSNIKTVYHYCYLIPSNKLDEAIVWLQDKIELITVGGEVIHQHTHWNAAAIYFYDADGNIGELIARYDLPYISDHPFTYTDILCMNEIGLPSSDCRKLNAEISDKIGTEIWKGDLDRFVVNGDQEGMFLLVNNTVKDKWYPTNIFPETVNIEALINHQDQLTRVIYDDQNFKVVL